MTVTDQSSSISLRLKLIVITAIVISGVFVALYFLITTTALSDKGTLFELYVPSKNSSDTFYLDKGEFTTMHSIAAGAFLLITIAALWFLRAKQQVASTALHLGMVGLSSIYSAVLLGNVLYQEYGNTVSVISVLGVFAIGFGFFYYLLISQIIRSKKTG